MNYFYSCSHVLNQNVTFGCSIDSRHRNDDVNQLSALILFVTILLSQTKIKNLHPVILYL